MPAYTVTNKNQGRDLYHQQTLADSLAFFSSHSAVGLSRRSSSPQAPHETLDPPPRKKVHHENFARGHKNPAKHGVLGNLDDPRVITNHK